MQSDNLHIPPILTTQKGCYVFTPDDADNVSQRPLKRRKTEPAKAPADQNMKLPFTPLLKGLEEIEAMRVRSEIFEAAWRPKAALLKVHKCS